MWYLLRIRPYRTLENVIRVAVITFTEITEIKRAEQILKESEDMRHLAAVVHDASDAIILQDLEGNILAWNPMAERIYGWSAAEALKMKMSSMIPEEQREEELAVLKKLSRAEVLKPYRTRRLTKEGRILNVCMTATSLVNEAGKVYGISTIEREIKA